MPRGLRCIVAAVAMVVVVAGCTGEEVTVPEGLLSAEAVGGTPFDAYGDYLASAGYVARDGGLVSAATGDFNLGYRLGEDGEEGVVVIGASPASQSLYQRDRRELIASLENEPPPRSPPATDKVRRLPANRPGTIALSVEYTSDGERTSIMRTYTYLEEADTAGEPVEGVLVMVSIETTGESDPSPEELERLTTAQIEKTLSSTAAPPSRPAPVDGVPLAAR